MEEIELSRAARAGDGEDLSSAFERLRLRDDEGNGDRRVWGSLPGGMVEGSCMLDNGGSCCKDEFRFCRSLR